MHFERAISLLIPMEGGYVNDHADRGGATRYGITERLARHYGYTSDMKDFPLEMAHSIYRQEFWDPSRGDELARISPSLAFEVFEAGVNCGPRTAVRWLQQAINACNIDRRTRDRLFIDLSVDGMIGPMTLKSLRIVSKVDEKLLYILCNVLQGYHYISLASQDHAQRAFLRGWILQRVNLNPENIIT